MLVPPMRLLSPVPRAITHCKDQHPLPVRSGLDLVKEHLGCFQQAQSDSDRQETVRKCPEKVVPKAVVDPRCRAGTCIRRLHAQTDPNECLLEEKGQPRR